MGPEGARELDDPGPGRLAVLVNRQGKGGMVFYYYDPARQAFVDHLDITTTVDDALAQRLMQAVNEGNPTAIIQLAGAVATMAHIAATTWIRLRLDIESFVEVAGQSYDHMMAAADSEVAQGHNPWQLANVPDLPEEFAGVAIPIDPKYDPGVWNRVTDVLMARNSELINTNEVATLIVVAARLWTLCRFDRASFATIARRVYVQATEDVASMTTIGQRGGQLPS